MLNRAGNVAPITEFAPAKVNLYLHITGRRRDRYHILDSLVVFADVGDSVRVTPSGHLSMTMDGAGAAGLASEPDNLVLRAARALAAAAGIAPRATIHLTKNLPVAAGLGGGSADAAATLRALDRLWGLRFGRERLAGMARGLGADVPVCVGVRPRRMSGVGDVLEFAPNLPSFGLVLANPRMALPTASVFAARRGPFAQRAVLPPSWHDVESMATGLGTLRNSLETVARDLCPAIGEVLAALGDLPGCRLARMSGSGATCFAIMDTAAAAAEAAKHLPDSWWRWGGAALPPPTPWRG